jgi:glycosyltransferase involved in cell wall biosynthesis
MLRVVILQKSLPQYREAFFTLLRDKLAESNITLDLIYGSMNEGRSDGVKLNWATYRENKCYTIGPLKLIWQPCLAEIKSADLVIVEQADKLLLNYVLFIRKIFGKQKFAFWGHGNNRQAKKHSLKNLFKRLFLKHSNWWFAYTSGTKSFLVKNGYPDSKITIVENAIDTKQMSTDYNNIYEEELVFFKEKYGLKTDETILIYCGALYKEKRLKFLIDTVDELVEMGHKIKLVVVGSGPDDFIIKEAEKTRSYVLFIGPLFGREKAKIFKLSKMFLLPGAIGLAVLDSFAFETPIITTKYSYHGPEFEYLINDFNGIITENDFGSYTKAISELLNNREKLQQIGTNCRSEVEKYSNENMVQNFAEGINNFFKGESTSNKKIT